ncbi:MAG: hypothetical protein K5663_06145 [Clostridiales bacterium]|nr:hypothetical protein [Clostridiales bacterium]
MTQSSKGTLKPRTAVVIIIVSVLGLYGLDALGRWAVSKGWISNMLGSVILWAAAVAAFIYILRRYCLNCIYELDGQKLSFYRVFFIKPRLEEALLTREILFFGDEDRAESKYAIKKRKSYSYKYSPYPRRAIVLKREGRFVLIRFNPMPEIAGALAEAAKK